MPTLEILSRRSLRCLAVLALAIGLAGAAAAQNPIARRHQPGTWPDRIALTWTDDPTTTQTVTWRTAKSIRAPVAQRAPMDAGPGFAAKPTSVTATTRPLETDFNQALFHTATFTDLAPGTEYLYRVGGDGFWSEWCSFRTASKTAEPFTFLYFGDAQAEIRAHWSRVIRTAYTHAPKARFLVHAGDLVAHSQSDAQWGEWFQAAGWINTTLPLVPVPGNHEYARPPAPEGSPLTPYWKAQFPLPDNGPARLLGTSYTFDYQGVRFVCLNANEKHKEQAPWLEQILSQNPQRWTVIVQHQPIYATFRFRDNPTLRGLWQPIFDRHRVDLVLQGHEHSYGRSGLLSASGQDANTVYVVSVSGPQMYRAEQRPWMRRWGQGIQLFQIISVDGDRLRFEARTATGALYDSFELRKTGGGPNTLTEGPIPEELPPSDVLPGLVHEPVPGGMPTSRRPAEADDEEEPAEPTWTNALLIGAIVLLAGGLIGVRLLRRWTGRSP